MRLSFVADGDGWWKERCQADEASLAVWPGLAWPGRWEKMGARTSKAGAPHLHQLFACVSRGTATHASAWLASLWWEVELHPALS